MYSVVNAMLSVLDVDTLELHRNQKELLVTFGKFHILDISSTYLESYSDIVSYKLWAFGTAMYIVLAVLLCLLIKYLYIS